MTEKHDIFLQVTQAPVLVITNPFLMQILDKREERRKKERQTIITWSKKAWFDFPFVFTAGGPAELGGMWEWTTPGGAIQRDHPPRGVPFYKREETAQDGTQEPQKDGEEIWNFLNKMQYNTVWALHIIHRKAQGSPCHSGDKP